MNETTELRAETVQLPATAPHVRVTAGLGSAGQKTWNLRRPVTLIGAKRPAHIVLHDTDISSAHCVVVNTGTDVLLKDLHTSGGTYCNEVRVDLTVLRDGDILRIGKSNIQIAIQASEDAKADSGCGMVYCDPTKFRHPIRLSLQYTDMRWMIEDAVALLGRHADAAVRLDHPEVSSRHSVMFRFQDGPAVFDLGHGEGLQVNGQCASLTPIREGDAITVGPFTLCCEKIVQSSISFFAKMAEDRPVTPPPAAKSQDNGNLQVNPSPSALVPREVESNAGAPETASAPLSDLMAEPVDQVHDEDRLRQHIGHSWEKLNSWQSRLQADQSSLNERQTDLQTRQAEVDAKDAALRGRLHDITQFHEQVLQREREVAELAAKAQREVDALTADRKVFERRLTELEKREKEVKRRERAVSQRWTRIASTTCPNCGQPVSLRGND